MATHPRRENVGQQASADKGPFLLPADLLIGDAAIQEIRTGPAASERSLSNPISAWGHSGFTPQLALRYDSGAGSGRLSRPAAAASKAAGPLQTTPGTDDL
jgi:hypothetical protein